MITERWSKHFLRSKCWVYPLLYLWGVKGGFPCAAWKISDWCVLHVVRRCAPRNYVMRTSTKWWNLEVAIQALLVTIKLCSILRMLKLSNPPRLRPTIDKQQPRWANWIYVFFLIHECILPRRVKLCRIKQKVTKKSKCVSRHNALSSCSYAVLVIIIIV